MLISDFGMVFRVSKRNWLKWLKAFAENKTVNQDGWKFLGMIDHTITDLTAKQAKELIEDIKNDERRNRAIKSRNKATRGANKTKG